MKSALIAALLVAAPAEQAQRPCLTHAQIEAMTLFALPPLLEGAAKACGPTLPAGAYLTNGGRTLSQTLAAESSTHWASARPAVTQLGGKDFPAGLSETTARGLLHDIVLNGLSTAKGRVHCGRIDRAANLLSPLPPRNMAGLLVLAMEMFSEDEARDQAVATKGKPKVSTAPKAPLICPSERP
ncbi:MAG TPA: hypothetical protein VFR28_08105 [Allosphingosinicella sp.]|nr:hypothetical protein [Allosphingosinicella sp.]